jgi:hypothetical protein
MKLFIPNTSFGIFVAGMEARGIFGRKNVHTKSKKVYLGKKTKKKVKT